MIDVSNIVFTQVKYAVIKKYPLANYANAIQGTPTSFPCLYINQFDNPIIDTDFANNENAVSSNVQIRTYTTGTNATIDAKAMLVLADTTMQKLGYRRTYGPHDMEVTNPTQFVSRYERKITNGDVLLYFS